MSRDLFKMKTSLPTCPFCDEPRKGAFQCPNCGADLVWMIPWADGGAALPDTRDQQTVCDSVAE